MPTVRSSCTPCPANRRAERREEIVAQACRELDFPLRRRLDLSGHERDGRYLEGTGSLVFDPRRRVAYACLSPRTDLALLNVVRLARLRADAVPRHRCRGRALVSHQRDAGLGSGFAWWRQAIEPQDRDRVLQSLAASGRDLVEIIGRGGRVRRQHAGTSASDEAPATSVLVMSARRGSPCRRAPVAARGAVDKRACRARADDRAGRRRRRALHDRGGRRGLSAVARRGVRSVSLPPPGTRRPRPARLPARLGQRRTAGRPVRGRRRHPHAGQRQRRWHQRTADPGAGIRSWRCRGRRRQGLLAAGLAARLALPGIGIDRGVDREGLAVACAAAIVFGHVYPAVTNFAAARASQR